MPLRAPEQKHSGEEADVSSAHKHKQHKHSVCDEDNERLHSPEAFARNAFERMSKMLTRN